MNEEGSDGTEAVFPKTSGVIAGFKYSYLFSELKWRIKYYERFGKTSNSVGHDIRKVLEHLDNLETALKAKREKFFAERVKSRNVSQLSKTDTEGGVGLLRDTGQEVELMRQLTVKLTAAQGVEHEEPVEGSRDDENDGQFTELKRQNEKRKRENDDLREQLAAARRSNE